MNLIVNILHNFFYEGSSDFIEKVNQKHDSPYVRRHLSTFKVLVFEIFF